MHKLSLLSGSTLCFLTSVSAACNPVDDYRISSGRAANAATETKLSDASTLVMIEAPPIKRRRAGGAAADGGTTQTASADAGSKDAALHATDAGSEHKPESADAAAASGDAGAALAEAPPAPMEDQAGWAALLDWPGLPTFSDAAPQLFSTHERGEGQMFSLVDPGNKDFNSFLAICGGELPMLIDQQNDAAISCQPGETGYLVAADDGPGYVSRILLSRGVSNPSSSVLVNVKPTDERIRIYLDGASTPAFDGTWLDWADARNRPFDGPLTAWTSGGMTSYLPISYSSKLRVFADKLATAPTLYYIQVDTRRVPQTKSFDASVLTTDEARAKLSALMERAQGQGKQNASWFEQQVALDGEGTSTPWTRERGGTLQRLEIKLERANANDVMRETALRLSWDDGAPAIDLPLEALFGARQGLAALSTLPMMVEVNDSEVRLSLTLPMPFSHSAKLELVHASDNKRSLGLRLLGVDQLPRGEWGRLHSSLSQQSAPMSGQRFRVAALSGKGKYLGVLLYAKGKSDNSRAIAASELGFLEGDERLEIDGQVVGLGTGTDNFFNGGFYFRDGAFSSPFAAAPQLVSSTAEGTSDVTLLRWTILSDALNFQRDFQLSLEFGADRPATVREYAAVSFYYQ